MLKITKHLLIILSLMLGSKSFSQKYKRSQNLPKYDYQKIHFGFTLGINELNFNVQRNSNTITNDSLKTLRSKSQKGFNLGIVSNLRLGKFTDLRFVPALIFGERHLNYGFIDSLNTSQDQLKKIESIKKALEKFSGIQRRFTKIFSINKVDFYDDYAHHPTEIKAVLNGAKDVYKKRKIVSIFQPHRYSRVKLLAKEFAQSFQLSNIVIDKEIEYC